MTTPTKLAERYWQAIYDVYTFTEQDRISHGLANEQSIVEITDQKSLLKAIKAIRAKGYTGFDTETTGLSMFDDDIVLVQLGDLDTQYLIWYNMIDPTPITELLGDKDILKVGTNLKFDSNIWLAKHGLKARLQNVYDTQLAEQVLGCGLLGKPGQALKMTALGPQVRNWLGYNIPKDEDIRTDWRHDQNPLQWPDCEARRMKMRYAADDIVWPLRVRKPQRPWLKELGLNRTMKLEMEFLPVVSEMEVRGLKLDRQAWTDIADDAYNKLRKATRQLDEIFGVPVKVKISEEGVAEYDRDLDYASSHQIKDAIRKYMWDEFGLDVIGKNCHFKESLERNGRMNQERINKLFRPRLEPNPDKPGKNKQVAYPNGTDVVKEWWDEFSKFLPSTSFLFVDTDSVNLKILKIINKTNKNIIDDKHKTKSGLPAALVDPLLAHRKYSKICSTYGMKFLDRLRPDTNRIHTNVFQAALSTGRTSTSPNVQNLPAGQITRSCFIAEEGYDYIGADWSQIEPRIQAELSREPVFMRVFWSEFPESEGFEYWCGPDVKEALDLYTEVGKVNGIIPVTYTVADTKGETATELGLKGRKQSKITVLGLSYGTGLWKFFIMLTKDTGEHQTWEHASKLFYGFWKGVPKLKKAMDHLSFMAGPDSPRRVKHPMRKNPVTFSETLGGRKRYYDDKAKNTHTEGRNQPIQGSGADIMKHGAVVMAKWCWEQPYDVGFVNMIHDEFILEGEKPHSEKVKTKLLQVMQDVGELYLPHVPVTSSGYIESYWLKD